MLTGIITGKSYKAGRASALLKSAGTRIMWVILSMPVLFCSTINGVKCGDFLPAADVEVEIGGGRESLDMLGTIAGGLLIVAGMLMFVAGLFTYLESKSEDNAGNEAKAIRRMGVGLALMAGPTILNKIFN